MKSYLSLVLVAVLLASGCGRQNASPSGKHRSATVSAQDKARAEQLRFQAAQEVEKSVPENAVNLLTKALEVDPTNGLVYRDRGVILVQNEETDEGIADLTEAASLIPDDAGVFQFLAIAYSDKHDFDRAIANYTKAIRLDGGRSPILLGSRGEAYVAAGDLKRAAADYAEAVAKAQGSVELSYNLRYQLALCLLGTGRTEEAIRELQESLRLNPRFPMGEAKLGLALSRLGRNQEAQAHFAAALRAYDGAVASQPEQPVYFRGRSEIHRDMGHKTQAEADAREADRLEVNRELAVGQLALSGHYHDRAIGAYTRALRVDPSNPELYRLRATAFEMKGNSARAEADRKRAAELGK